MSAIEYCEITIEVFLNMQGQIPFDVYIQLSPGKYTKIFNRNDMADRTRFEKYLKKGAISLFISRKDRREYIAATERFIRKIITQSVDKISPQDASRAIEELAEQTLFEIFEDKLFDENSLRIAQDIAKSYIQFLKSDPKILTQFLQLCKNETYMVRHSITTTVIAVLIAKSASNENDRTLQIIGLGALLHDIGMAQISDEINELERKLSAEEWTIIKAHTQTGSDTLRGVKNFPEELANVIEQHHESYDGTGYPKGLKGEEIYYPARIVAIADCFSALTTRRGGRSLFTPEEAIALLLTEKRKYDPKLLVAFEDLLAPKKKKVA
ncbi:MAG: HD domain-containing phosphohydrolase [Oligoflexia bacterium]|nr:HD domain-containing phosphohydrolase [Oligoflexia bacterium]